MAEPPSWQWRSVRLQPALDLPGWRRVEADRLEDGAGGVLLVVGEPADRTWTSGGILTAAQPVEWALENTAEGAVLRAAEAAEVDLVELHDAAAAAVDEPFDPMTVLGSFTPVGGASTLGRFLVGTEVLDTNDFGGRRCPSEQTALSLYRVARLRGGAFWTAVADHVAAVAARRITAAATPVHGVYGGDETHTRFLADAALLLLAHGHEDLARRAVEGLDALSVPYAGGRWTLHDSDERDRGDNWLVLNTHVQATLARLAVGDDVTADLRAMDAALRLRVEPRRALPAAARLLAADAAHGWLGRHTGGSAQERAAQTRTESPHLVLPGGWIARDAGGGPAPAYLTVNLYDLAGLCANHPTPTATKALRRGLRYARWSGYFRAIQRDAHPQAAVAPIALRMAGLTGAARRAAARAAAAGWPPAVGWPGRVDRLWSALVPGTP